MLEEITRNLVNYKEEIFPPLLILFSFFFPFLPWVQFDLPFLSPTFFDPPHMGKAQVHMKTKTKIGILPFFLPW